MQDTARTSQSVRKFVLHVVNHSSESRVRQDPAVVVVVGIAAGSAAIATTSLGRAGQVRTLGVLPGVRVGVSSVVSWTLETRTGLHETGVERVRGHRIELQDVFVETGL